MNPKPTPHMTQADIEAELERSANEAGKQMYNPMYYGAYRAGANAAIKLMLERERVLREALDKRAVNPECQACAQNFHDDSYTLSVQIPEWSFEKEDV